MDIYPAQYVELNLPLVFLSGLGSGEDRDSATLHPKRQESGAKINIESPECRDEKSKQLLREIGNFDGTRRAWNDVALPGPTGSMRYSMRNIGRSYTLPARKAAPLPQSPGAEGSTPRSTELHSPLSPLSPGSPIFPDGIFTPLWFSKHQSQIPSLFLTFFNLDTENPSQDDQLKSDINAARAALSRSGFKTRFAVVLLSDRSILHAPDLEDRLAGIRRAANLNERSGLFFMPPMSSQAEIATFVQGIFHALQPSCVEYYRDLTKHARRKKARGGPLSPLHLGNSGASQITSTSGWNVRYEVKQGVFAEFRQEMDVAERHYSSAIEELFSSEGGVFDTTANWSPRWDEARLLCDALAIRVLRCQLWCGQTTGAAQSWQNYKLRMMDLVDRRGKGSNTYGWDAWEARWAGVMSELIDAAKVPSLRKPAELESGDHFVPQTYMLPERATDRMSPFNFLHHPGYWMRLMAQGFRNRWERALEIPEEDRVPPGQSPASIVANRFKTYDVYLVPEPHQEARLAGDATYEHSAELSRLCLQAAEEFASRRQLRMSQEMRLELADGLVQHGRYSTAAEILVQLWEDSTWRNEDWSIPFGKLLTLLTRCIYEEKLPQNAALAPALTWELLSIASVDATSISPSMPQCLDPWDVDEKIDIRLSDSHCQSPISALFAFKDRECHIGELVEMQLLLRYSNAKASQPLDLSEISFKLGESTIVVHDDASEKTESAICRCSQASEAEDGMIMTSANLSVEPTRDKILHVLLPLREAINLTIKQLKTVVDTPKFRLTHQFADSSVRPSPLWYVANGAKVESLSLPHFDVKSIQLLPKPPKMQVLLRGIQKELYTDERVHLQVELINGEDEAVHATIVPKIIGQSGHTIPFKWSDKEEGDNVRSLQDMEASTNEVADLIVHGPPEAGYFTLSLDLRYTLISDPSTPLTKTVSTQLAFTTAFETKFNFAAQLHPGPWPSYFDAFSEGTEDTPDGIPQLWRLEAEIACLATHSLSLQKLELSVHDVHGDSSCHVLEPVAASQITLHPSAKTTAAFEIKTQKFSLDDRRPSLLDLSLVVTWGRSEADEQTSAETIIALPRLTVPTSEPRVLCTSFREPNDESLTLRYHLENPSTHFLTFALTMEASEDFAFKGPKYRTLSLAPLSRHHVDYRLLLHDGSVVNEEDAWIDPKLQVVDSYYQKNLRVHPGGKGVRAEPAGAGGEIRVWVGKGEAPFCNSSYPSASKTSR